MKVLVALLVLVAVFWIVTLWKANRHELRAEAAFPPSGEFLEVDGIRVHYVIKGQGPDLVLIHGASGNLRDMTFSLVDKLARDYRVVAFDRPGLGYTDRMDPKGTTIVQQAGLLSKAAEELGMDHPIVLGQSYGGSVALAWAVHHPENVSAIVTLGSPSLPWDTGLSTYYRLTSSRWLGPIVNPVLAAWVPDRVVEDAIDAVFEPQDAPQGYGAHIGAPLTLRRQTITANALQRAQLLEQVRALEPRYGEINVPIEMVHGAADTTVGVSIHSAPFAERYPNANLVTLEGIGHMPHHVREGAVLEAIHRAASRAGLR
ncbi:alpha/beta fold hydrolase [Thalassococcus lentus]|uniref:Alpha/beta hydrolase n=1 Tax=Thalassococcus lentus TaxID=1210524 RepID=A0ABT4XQG4_9RHOB|nr:alpha/beta hydrolase [Thalassococcus lentus]MDA7424142.1 alpha/beta hydrolase [Thalassococcus lentus]